MYVEYDGYELLVKQKKAPPKRGSYGSIAGPCPNPATSRYQLCRIVCQTKGAEGASRLQPRFRYAAPGETNAEDEDMIEAAGLVKRKAPGRGQPRRANFKALGDIHSTRIDRIKRADHGFRRTVDADFEEQSGFICQRRMIQRRSPVECDDGETVVGCQIGNRVEA